MIFINNFRNDGDTLGLFGCLKDESSQYLNYFPSCFKKMFIEIPLYGGLSATDIRNKYFDEKVIDETSLPQGVVKYLESYKQDFNYRCLPSK